MTYEKAIETLIAAGYLTDTDREPALTALSSTRTEFTYPDWAQALADANLIQPPDIATVADFLEQAANKFAQTESEDDLDQFEDIAILTKPE